MMLADAYMPQHGAYIYAHLAHADARALCASASAPISEKIGAVVARDEHPQIWTSIDTPTENLVVSVNDIPASFRFIFSSSIPEDPVFAKEIPIAVPFSERLESIQNKLSLSITQLAELFGVTRKSIYDWYDQKATPRSSAVNRLELIGTIISGAPKDVDLTNLKNVWAVPVSGKSFLSLLGSEDMDPKALQDTVRAKLDELAPRLGRNTAKNQSTYNSSGLIGAAHISDIDRTTDAV